MSQLPIDAPDIPVTPLIPVSADGWADWIAARPDRERTWAQAAGFTGQAGTVCAIPDADGGLERVLAGIGDGGGSGALWDWAGLPG
ncbi:MAG: hypothetical protein KDE22_08495, partial [Rhodobacterales bacterium]|nr:hypothetical protein [Rhodobacterales bacterium]